MRRCLFYSISVSTWRGADPSPPHPPHTHGSWRERMNADRSASSAASHRGDKRCRCSADIITFPGEYTPSAFLSCLWRNDCDAWFSQHQLFAVSLRCGAASETRMKSTQVAKSVPAPRHMQPDLWDAERRRKVKHPANTDASAPVIHCPQTLVRPWQEKLAQWFVCKVTEYVRRFLIRGTQVNAHLQSFWSPLKAKRYFYSIFSGYCFRNVHSGFVTPITQFTGIFLNRLKHFR